MSRALALQALLAAAAPPQPVAGPRIGFGLAGLDDRLGGGLAGAAAHEIIAAGEGDGAAAAGFALLLALRSVRPGPIVWLREARVRGEGRPYGLGIAELGLAPERLLLVDAPDTLAVLRAGADAVACGAVAVAIIEPHGRAAALDLTASRRLALAAAKSGVLVLLLRGPGDPLPSAAHSRWQVAAAPSNRIAGAPGLPAFDISLVRHRGGAPGFTMRLEWDRDRRVFGTPLPGAAPALAPQRAAAPRAPPRVAGERRAAA
jgi:protein ImuA